MKKFLDDICLSPAHLPSHSVDPIWGKSMAVMTELLTEAMNSESWEQQQRESETSFAKAASNASPLSLSSSGAKNVAGSVSALQMEERIENTTMLSLSQTLAGLNSVIESSQAEIVQRDVERRQQQHQQSQLSSMRSNQSQSRSRFNSTSATSSQISNAGGEKLGRAKSDEKTKRIGKDKEAKEGPRVSI